MEINPSPATVIQSPVPAVPLNSFPPEIQCKKCKNDVKTEFFFCPTCGFKLKQPPVSTSIMTQIKYYVGSILLFPIGIVWGYRYLKDERTSAKIIGIVLILATLIFGILIAIWTVQTINTVSDQINQQMKIMNGGF